MLEQLIINNSPILYLHSSEKDFPSSIDKYLNNVNVVIDEIIQLVNPMQSELHRFSQQCPDIRRAHMKIRTTHGKLGDSTLQAPVYAIIQDFDNLAPNIYVTYIYFYPYNSSYNILGLAQIGEHHADIEHITIEFNRYHHPLRYYFAAHGNAEGSWYEPHEIEYEGIRPIVYVAKGSHASYNRPGIFPRFFGTVTDKTNKGYRWDPYCQIIWYPSEPNFTEDNSWLFYPGKWGDTGIRGVVDQQWFKELPTVSKNPRCFTPACWSIISAAAWIMYFVLVCISGVLITDCIIDTSSQIEVMLIGILIVTGVHTLIQIIVICVLKFMTKFDIF